MHDSQLLALYTQAYNTAGQTGGGGQALTPQRRHIAGLRALTALGNNAAQAVDADHVRVPKNENQAKAHQRRLISCDHWLAQHGRRSRYAGNPTFTAITDAFAAGGAYERTYFQNTEEYNAMASTLIEQTENDVAKTLEEAVVLGPLVDALMERFAPTAASPEELIAAIEACIAGAAPAGEPYIG